MTDLQLYQLDIDQSGRGGSRKAAKLLKVSILIAFAIIWKVLLSNRNVATFLDPPLSRVEPTTSSTGTLTTLHHRSSKFIIMDRPKKVQHTACEISLHFFIVDINPTTFHFCG